MNNVVLILAAIVVTILAALFAIPPLIDWNTYRGVFEVEASRLLGRDVRVRGDVQLSLLPVPYLEFEDVTIANAPGVTGEPFLRAKTFSLRLSAPPLLRGAIEAKQIEVDGARFRLRLDENGRGNWQDFEGAQARFGLSPTEVSLNAVNFNDVGVTLEQADGGQVFELNGVSGALSAPNARGPFRFVGTVDAPGNRDAGSALGLRVSTGLWDDEGRAEIRVALAREGDARTLAVAGRLAALGAQPFGFEGQIEGDLAMLLPAAATTGTTAQPVALARGAQRIQGAMRITPSRLEIKDLKLDLARTVSPQVLLGMASWQLAADAPLNVTLRSDLLDAEQLGLAEESSDGISLYRLLLDQVGGLRRTVSALGRPTNLDVRVDRLTLGRTSLSGLEFVAKLSDQATEVRRMKFQAPGTTTGFAEGTIEVGGDDTLAFAGMLKVDGRNLVQFARWAWPGAPLAERRAQRPFGLQAQVIASPASLALTDARVSVGRDTMLGSLDFDAAGDAGGADADRGPPGDGGTLEIDLAGPVVDLGLIDPEFLAPSRLRSFFSQAGAPALELPWRIGLRLTADELRDSRRRYRGAEISLVRRADGAVILRELAVSTPEGGRVDMRGRWQPMGAGRITGQLSGRAMAPGPAAAASLLALAGQHSGAPVQGADPTNAQAGAEPSGGGRSVADLIGALSLPATDIAFTAAFNDADTSQARAVDDTMALRATADGMIGGDRVTLTYAAQSTDWRIGSGRIAVDLAAQGGTALDIVRLVRGLEAQSANVQEARPADGAAGAALRLIAAGIPEQGVRTTATLTSAGGVMVFDGAATLALGQRPGERPPRWTASGELRVRATSARDVLTALHLPRLAERVGSTPLCASLTLGADPAAAAPAPREIVLTDFTVGGVTGRGTLQLSDANAITGSLSLNRLALSDGLALLARPLATGEADGPSDGEVWPGSPLDVSVFEGLTADVAVETAALVVVDGAVLSNAALRVVLAGDRVALEDIRARTPLNGEIGGAVTLAASAGGYRLSGAFDVTKANLAGFDAPAARPPTAAGADVVAPPAGRAEIAFNFEGRGGSMQSLVSLANGDGQVRLRGVSLAGVAPAAIRAAGDAFGIDDRITAERLNEVLRRELLAKRSTLGDQDLALRVRDGIVSVAPLRVGVAGGRIENTTTIALGTLVVDSRWRLTPVPREGEGDALPAIELIYAAPLLEIATTEPEIRSDSLVREMVVRRLEGNVAELERLRRLDEARAQRQADLQAQREREREAARIAAEEAARARREAERATVTPEAVPGMLPDEGAVQRAPLPPPPDRRSNLNGPDPDLRVAAEERVRREVRTFALPTDGGVMVDQELAGAAASREARAGAPPRAVLRSLRPVFQEPADAR